jgi:hypothetical protein
MAAGVHGGKAAYALLYADMQAQPLGCPGWVLWTALLGFGRPQLLLDTLHCADVRLRIVCTIRAV